MFVSVTAISLTLKSKATTSVRSMGSLPHSSAPTLSEATTRGVSRAQRDALASGP